MGDLFNGEYPPIAELAADTPPMLESLPGSEAWCDHCRRTPGKGNICFLSEAAFRAYCADLAAAKMRTLAQHLMSLPTREQRRARLNAFARHWQPETVETLRQMMLTIHRRRCVGDDAP